MMTISKPQTASSASGYFREEYEHERGSYYAKDERIVGRWEGELAPELGLAGNVREEQFLRLAEGQDPRTGAQLVRRVRAHERMNKFGDVRKTLGHRAGVDITLSAPKSVTLAAVVGGDERIREAHREANRAALREVERRLQARSGGSRAPETTGRAVIATFEHDVARPDRRGHYAAPDLHTHNFVFNLTKTAAGKFRSVDMTELYRCQKLGTAVYRAKLAEGLQRLGYEIRIDERTGAPEIAGISRAYIEASSPRQAEIKETAERLRTAGRQKGMVRADGTTSTRAAATVRRRSKVFDREEMRQRHQELEARFGEEGRQAVVTARTRALVFAGKVLQHDPAESRARAQAAVTYAMAKLSERAAVYSSDVLLAHALARGVGATTLEDVEAEIAHRHERGELIPVTNREAARRQVMTERSLAMEQANIATMRAGQGVMSPISPTVPERLVTSQGVELNEGQRAAVAQIVTSTDRVQGLRGGANTGKASVLAVVKAEAERAGYAVRGFASTTRVAQLLTGSGIEAQPLQRSIREQLEPETVRRLLVLDEISLVSTRQLNAFLSKARSQDRVLLVGNVRQHEGVKIGNPFVQLQNHGMQTARLEKIVQHKEERLRRGGKQPAGSEVKEAVRQLPQTTQKGMMHEQTGRITTQTRADQTGASRAAGAVAGTVPSAFDRSRIRRPAAHAGADGRTGAAVDHRSLAHTERRTHTVRSGVAGADRGTEATDRVIVSSESGRGPLAAPDRTGRDTVRERHRAAGGDQSVGAGHARGPAPDRREAVQFFNLAEQEHIAAGGGRDGAQRHPAPHPDNEQGHVAGESSSSSRLSAGVPNRRTAVTGPEFSSHRSGQLPATGGARLDAPGRVDLFTCAAEPRGGRRAEPSTGDSRLQPDAIEDYRRDNPRGVGDTDLRRRESALMGVAEPVDSRHAAQRSESCAALAGRDLAHVDNGDEVPLAHHSNGRGAGDLSVDDGIQRVPFVGGTAIDREQRVGTLAESGRSSIADEVRAILDRPMQVERMALELVQLANANRLAQGSPPLAGQLQAYMYAQLTNLAEHPPTPAQVMRDQQLAQARGEAEPQHESALLASSLYAARYAPARSELLEQFTVATETAYERDQAPVRTVEYSRTEPDYSFSR